MTQTLKQYALDCAALGLSVFPIRERDKRPAINGWQTEATQDTGKIERWWTENPLYNIGIACGSASGGLVVIDLDIDSAKGKDGTKRLTEWLQSQGQSGVIDTAIVSTGRGGKHIYYRDPQNTYKNATDLFKDSSGVDVRGEGGYVVAPGSIHQSGNIYRWEKSPVLCGIQPLPAFIGNILHTPMQGKPQDSNTIIPTMGDIPEGQRTSSLFKALSSLQAKGLTDEAIKAAIRAENENRCVPPLSEYELETEIFPALKRYQKATAPYTFDRDYNTDVSELVELIRAAHPEQNKRYGWNDAGNGNLFSDLCEGVARYVPERKRWYYYDGARWLPDTDAVRTKEYCKAVANALMIYTAQYVTDGKQKDEYIKHIAKWQQYRYRETILKDAATVAPVTIADFDSDTYLLNCENGTLNLHDGSFYEHTAADNITKLANVSYDPQARSERWERFIDEITLGDTQLARYIQKAMGYALTGDTRFECFFILYGATSRNGKGTLCETFMRMIGDYGKTASAETVAQKKYSDSRSPSEDIAKLAGARFVNMSEPDKKMIFNAASLKTMTGNDTITARFLGENSFEYKPQFKIFINTNHLPYINDTTLFSSDRVKVIPFRRHFEESERDVHLKHTLTKANNMSGILNWCLAGLQLLQSEGWTVPEAVKEATQSYEETSDKLGQFLDEVLQCDPHGECDARIVHTAYQDWCFNCGLKAEGFGEFKKSLASAGIEVRRKRPAGSNRDTNKKQIIEGYTLTVKQ